MPGRAHLPWSACLALAAGLLTALPAAAQGSGDADPEAAPAEATAPPAERAAPPDTGETPTQAPVEIDDTANLDTPAFPQDVRYWDAVRLRLESSFLPNADLDDTNATLYQPNGRLRVTLPLSSRALLRLTARGGSDVYDFDGDFDPLDRGRPSKDPFDDFYRASLSLQAGWLINGSGHWLFDGESWSLLIDGFGRSRWEAGAFEDALTGGGAVGLGYELPGRVRVAVGLGLESRLTRGGVRLRPIGSLRWRVTDRITLRNRERGGQIEYKLLENLELFAAGFYQSSRFLLDDRTGVPSDTTLRDRQFLTGAGLEWRILRQFRLNAEAGAVAWRKFRVKSRDHGTLINLRGDPSPYVQIRFEIRP